MLVDKGASNSPQSIGGWATPQQFSSLEEARKSLALLPEFKETSKCCDVLELTVTNPIPVRSGWAGPIRLIYAELSGGFPLGDSRQPTYKSLRPFDLVS
ncbi:MAG: hypothetical protein ACK4FM_05105 [Caldimicrobium sp.]